MKEEGSVLVDGTDYCRGVTAEFGTCKLYDWLTFVLAHLL